MNNKNLFTPTMSRWSASVLALFGVFVGCSDAPEDVGTSFGELSRDNARADIVLQSNWTGGYCAKVFVENDGAAATSWELGLQLNDARLDNFWSSNFSGDRGSVLVTPESYNQELQAGEQTSFGYCVEKTGPNWEPTLQTLTLVRPGMPGGEEPGGTGGTNSPGNGTGGTTSPGTESGGTMTSEPGDGDSASAPICQGGVCCPASCGQCGGSGCGELPGGGADCCTGRIKNSGVYCEGDSEANAPCIQGSNPGGACTAQEIDGRLVHGDATPLVSIDPTCGRVTYGMYANQDQNRRDNLLPDFSFAGYMKGGVAIPDVPAVETVRPRQGDDRAAIQAAIDRVSRRTPNGDGFRGAVQLTAGTYQVGDTLEIRKSGVVLRGAGQGEDGTVLVATARREHDLIRLQGAGSGLGERNGTRVKITSSYVGVGSRSFEVEDADGYRVGDVIGVLRTPNQRWINQLGMGEWGWTPRAYAIAHERTIVALEGNQITVDIPIVDTMERQYGGGSVFLANVSRRIEQCGVEDLRLRSNYQSPTDENHGWSAVTFSQVANSWVRRVTAQHFGYAAVHLTRNSSFNTIEDTAQLDPISQVRGGRRYSFNISGGTGNLFQRCFARDGRHNFVTGARVPGPNVWLDCLSVENNTDEGPHHRWATGLLYDNTASKYFHVQNRSSSGSGHGWAGAQTLFWNVDADEIRSDAPSGAMNWVVGGRGAKTEGRKPQNGNGNVQEDPPFGIWESHGRMVTPRSLYLAQLEDRLGADAVAAVTIPEQRSGDIESLLRAWAGEGDLTAPTSTPPLECDGILASGDICCPNSCGQCGGAGCGSAPGGGQNCCTGRIREANLSCASNAPPCVMP